MTSRKRPALDLEFIGVPIGSTLEYDGDRKVTCMVVSQRSPVQVVYGQEVETLNSLTKRLTGTEAPNPATHWLYDGDTLWNRRMRFEDYHRHREHPDQPTETSKRPSSGGKMIDLDSIPDNMRPGMMLDEELSEDQELEQDQDLNEYKG